MSAYYLDTSAAVKAYSEEWGSDRVEEILNLGEEIYLSRVGIVEVAAAIFGKTKTGAMQVGEAVITLEELRRDVQDVYKIVEVDPATADRAIEAAERHQLRAYDCLQLATALLLQGQRDALGFTPLVLVSSDGELNAAAESEGLTVEDPAM